MSSSVSFRKAKPGDGALVLSFIRALAEYEKMLDVVSATADGLEQQLFELHSAEVFFALENGIEVGFALFFYNFSTFLGLPGLYIEDIFVLPEFRRRGIGKAIFTELARIALQRGCGRLEWSCLDWNTPSIAFYKSLGAIPMDEWTVYRVTGDALTKLGTERD